MTQKTTLQQESEPKGMVMWDQRGLVVVWPDQHCSHFSWEALRHICLCVECQGQRTAPETVPQYSA